MASKIALNYVILTLSLCIVFSQIVVFDLSYYVFTAKGDLTLSI